METFLMKWTVQPFWNVYLMVVTMDCIRIYIIISSISSVNLKKSAQEIAELVTFTEEILMQSCLNQDFNYRFVENSVQLNYYGQVRIIMCC